MHIDSPGNTTPVTRTNKLLNIIKQAINKNTVNNLQAIMVEYLTKNSPENNLTGYWECIDYMNRPQIKLAQYAQFLSNYIVNYLIEYNYNMEALEHIRKTAGSLDQDRKFRQKIIQLYKTIYIDNIHLDTFISLSSIKELIPLEQSINTLDKLLSLRIGEPVYSSRYGYGEITRFDFLLDTLTVNFFKGQIQTVTIDQAIKTLQPLPVDNIYYLIDRKSQIPAQLIKDNPSQLEKILKRDISLDLNSPDVKKILKGAVDESDIKSFTEYLKRTKPKTKKIQKENKSQGAEIDYSSLTNMTADEITRLLNDIPANSKYKAVLELKNRSDWQELYSVLFFAQTDKRVLSTILTNLNSEYQIKLVDKTLIEYKRYPEQFFMIAESKTETDPYAVLTRYLDIATQMYSKQYQSEIRKRLIDDNYQLIKDTASQIQPDYVKRILERVEAIKNFYPEEQDEIKRIFKENFPELFSAVTDYIYHTDTAIKNKTDELKTLITEEIPRVANEIAHARGYGDLRENFEFKAAKEKQKRLLNKVSQIRHELVIARSINFRQVDINKVSIGTTVKMSLTDNQSQVTSYSILGPWDSDLNKGIISYLAPFAQNLLNRKIGDTITDSDGKTYKVIEITNAQASLNGN